MSSPQEQTGLVILGSIFLGIWIFGILWGFGFENPAGWIVWGFVGLLIAGAGYGVRATEGPVRIALLAGLGILSTVLFLSALASEDPSVFGAVCTALGAGFIAAALPGPGGHRVAPAQQGHAPHASHAAHAPHASHAAHAGRPDQAPGEWEQA